MQHAFDLKTIDKNIIPLSSSLGLYGFSHSHFSCAKPKNVGKTNRYSIHSRSQNNFWALGRETLQ
jgi:hypothetical protein